MTATATATAVPAPGAHVRTVAGRLAWRSIALLPRSPATFIPTLVFPIFIVIAFGGAFSAVARVPGFPAKAMIDWVLPMAIVQGAGFAGVNAGMSLAHDIETGFFDRLLVAPVRPVAIILGPLAAAMLRTFIPFTIVLITGLLLGAHLVGGLAGVLALLLAAEGMALVTGGWAIGLALRFGSMRAAPLMQVGFFLAVFLSTAQVPLEVMTGWLHSVARVNPMTNVFRLSRQGFIGHVSWAQTWPGLLALGLGGLLLGAFALRGLQKATP
jgi:ABC-2 type transport system permease protein